MRRSVAVARRVIARFGTAASNLVGLPVRAAVRWLPRDETQLVISGNSGQFVDNAKYLFLGADDDRLQWTWITTDRRVRDEVRALGKQAELRWSPAGIKACLRAGWFVYSAYLSDVNYCLSNGARSLNLWHGVPLKAIEFDIDSGPLARLYGSSARSPLRLAFPDRFQQPDFLLSTSRYISEQCLSSAFRVDAEQCLEFGYPRNDHFFDPGSTRRSRTALEIPEDVGEVIGYFPTWRDDGSDFLADAGFSFEELDQALAATQRLLVFKAHPNLALTTLDDSTFTNIRILGPAHDIYEVLPACDALITDYSSIAFDFLVLNRPIIYFVPDLDRYVKHRNLYFDFRDMAVGPIVRTMPELMNLIHSHTLPSVDSERHRCIRNLVWDDYAGSSVERIVDFVIETNQSEASTS